MCRAWRPLFWHHANGGHREGKRQADAVEDLETSDGKKMKLSDEPPSGTGTGEEEGAGAAADDMPLDVSAEQPNTISAVAAPVTPGPAKGSTGKGKKATKGADLSFKENPFTFLKADDPAIRACMYVCVVLSLISAH